jgi:hypothetical protein
LDLLPIDHSLAGVSRLYRSVNHAQVAARSPYCPVHGIPVVDPQQVMAAVTLGHVPVVGVSSGVEVVMAALGDHPVWHSVADLLEEHLVGSCGNTGDTLALDGPPITCWAKAVPALPKSVRSTTAIAIITAILLGTSVAPSFSVWRRGVFLSACLPLSRNCRYAHIDSSIWGATHPQSTLFSFCPDSPKCREETV